MRVELLEKVIRKFGKKNQIDKIQEEAQELALALHQYKCPTKDKEKGLDNIYDELADMTIMLAQANILFDRNRIAHRVDLKLKRLEGYLK